MSDRTYAPTTETRHCPKCGQVEFDSLDDRLYACAQCGYTYFNNTAAATSAIIWRADRIAVIRRAREPGEGQLDLPGGFVDPNESVEASVVREVREEIGAIVTSPRFLFSIPNHYCYHGINYGTVDIFFECELVRLPDFVPNEEASVLLWLAPADVDPLEVAFESVRIAIARLANGRWGAVPVVPQ